MCFFLSQLIVNYSWRGNTRHVALTIEETFGPPQKLEILDMDAAVNVHSWVSKIIFINNKGKVPAKSEAADIFATLPPGLDQPYSLISMGGW